MFEDLVQALWLRARGDGKDDRVEPAAWQKAVGFVWVVLWSGVR